MNPTNRKVWTRDELVLAINLYCKTPFGKIHIHNPEIIELAKKLDRTPGSISYKLANFASIDPSLDRKGASNVSKLDIQVWNEFYENWAEMSYQSEIAIDKKMNRESLDSNTNFPEGKTRISNVKTRINQSFFRKTILASYEKCCITGLPVHDLLIASHIIPWSVDKINRTNPHNGLCLNALHDKAFDKGLITIDENFRVVASQKVSSLRGKDSSILTEFVGKNIFMPKRFRPDQNFLEYHREQIFDK